MDCVMTKCVWPWYNCNGWLGIRLQVTYLLSSLWQGTIQEQREGEAAAEGDRRGAETGNVETSHPSATDLACCGGEEVIKPLVHILIVVVMWMYSLPICCSCCASLLAAVHCWWLKSLFCLRWQNFTVSIEIGVPVVLGLLSFVAVKFTFCLSWQNVCCFEIVNCDLLCLLITWK